MDSDAELNAEAVEKEMNNRGAPESNSKGGRTWRTLLSSALGIILEKKL